MVALAVLFAVFDSGSLPTTITVFVKVPAVVVFTTIVIVTLSPLARVPSWQVTTLVLEHVPFVVFTETNVTSVGSVSVATTPVAVPGPLLVATIVYVTWFPTVVELGDAVFVTARSIDL